MDLLLSWLVLAAGVWLATVLVSGVRVKGGFGSFMLVAALFGVLNFLIGWLVSFVVGVSSLGILFFFRLVLRLISDAIVLRIASGLSSRLEVKDFGTALLAALVMSGVGGGAEWLLTHL